MSAPIADFSARLLRWFDAHGRHDLPWQHPRTPYRVWLSEIMLQQTQVSTVIPYFLDFLNRFPTLRDLAEADEDEVMAAWAGLGYYRRARHLHAAANICVVRHGGELPRDIESLMALPGIGRSTAGAILAQAHDRPHAILDGNVKRVLTRLMGITRYPGESTVERELWEVSAALLPDARLADYTQALMDFGATLCTRSKPRCLRCPFLDDCNAQRSGRTASIPAAKPKRDYPVRDCVMLVALDAQGRVLLEKRPAQGVWAGLWSLPQGEDIASLLAQRCLPMQWAERASTLQAIEHKFTHYQLDITPLRVDGVSPPLRVQDRSIEDQTAQRWLGLEELHILGLPAPVRKLLDTITLNESIASGTPP